MRGLLVRICPLLGLVAVVGLSSPADAGKQRSADRQLVARPALPPITKFILPPGRTVSNPSQVRIIPIPTTWDAVMIPIPTEIDARIVLLKTKP